MAYWVKDPKTGKWVRKGTGALTPSGTAATSERGARSKRSGSDLSTSEGLEELARKKGLQPPDKGAVLNALDKIGRVLNVGTASVAGAVRGALRPELSVGEGIAEGLRKNIGFGDVLREEFGVRPQTAGGKVLFGTVSLAADILFDPITYLSLGTSAGAKVGGKALTKGATKIYNKAAQEAILEAGTKQVLNRKAVNELFESAASRRGLSDDVAYRAFGAGISEDTIRAVRDLGARAFDRGGIKLGGRSLLTGEQIRNAPVLGKALSFAGEKTAPARSALGEMFGFGEKNRKLMDILSSPDRVVSTAAKGFVTRNKELFSRLTNDQANELSRFMIEKKDEVLKTQKEIETSLIDEYNSAFPGKKIKTAEEARAVRDALEDLAERETTALRKKVDDIVQPMFARREEDILSGTKLEAGKEALQARPFIKSLERVDELAKRRRELEEVLRQLRKGRGKGSAAAKALGDLGGPITREEKAHVANKIISYQEERLNGIIDALQDKIDLAAGKGASTKAAKGLAKLTPEEEVVLVERRISQLQDELADKDAILTKVLGARRTAKEAQRANIDKIVKSVADEDVRKALTEILRPNGIVDRLRKAAGLSVEDAFATYFPSLRKKGKEAQAFFSFKVPLTSPQMGYMKEYKNLLAKEELITDPFQAFTTQQVRVLRDNLRSRTIERAVRAFGSKAPPQVAEAMGLKKFSRTLKGGKKVEAWLDTSIYDQLTKYAESSRGLKLVDELARVTGFDWATGLFKGYSTSMFPGFHIRNMTSNKFQSFLKLGISAFDPRHSLVARNVLSGKNPTGRIVSKNGRYYTTAEVRALAEKYDLLQEGAFGSMEQFLEREGADIYKGTRAGFKEWAKKMNPLSRTFAGMELGRTVGMGIENQARMSHFVAELVEGRTAKEAAESVEEALFNYAKITPFERSVMRRLIPFYTFARKNAELQIRAFSNPGRQAMPFKLARNLSASFGEGFGPEDAEGLPDYVQEQLGFKIGTDKNGLPVHVYSFGLPIEEFAGRFSGDKGILSNVLLDTITRMNPIIKAPVERAVGKEFFRDKDIAELTDAEDFKWALDAMPEGVSSQLKEYLEWGEKTKGVYVAGKKTGEKTVYTADPYKLHFFRNLFISRVLSTGGKAAKEATTNEEKWMKGLNLLTGVKATSIDVEQQKAFAEFERMDELQKWLYRLGIIGEKEVLYEKD